MKPVECVDLTLWFVGEAKKKKKKKKSKKKKTEKQSDPPRVGLSKFFPDGVYPEGEIQPYKDECVILFLQARTCILSTAIF